MKRRTSLVLGTSALLLGVTAAFLLLGRAGPERQTRPDLEQLREAAAQIVYPPAGASVPRSIVISFDAEKNRTRMVLKLSPVLSAPGFVLSDATLTLVSEFDGIRRDPSKPELSIRCEIAATTPGAGALAPSDPPAELIADGTSIAARAVTRGETGYSTTKSCERLKFKFSTVDLARAASAGELRVVAGMASARLTVEQVSDLRQFAARLNPNLAP